MRRRLCHCERGRGIRLRMSDAPGPPPEVSTPLAERVPNALERARHNRRCVIRTVVILNETPCSEGSGHRRRSLFRNPDPSAAPKDDRARAVGFTLIELLVVIAVIALLMGILLPVLGRARRQAKALGCQANLRQWAITLHTYTAENDGKLPCRSRGSLSAWLGAWRPLLRHEQDRNKIFLCPMTTMPAEDGVSEGATFRAFRVSLGSIGGPPTRETTCGSYGWNKYVATPDNQTDDRSFYWDSLDFKGAARGPLFFDCTHPWFGLSGGAMDSPPEREDTGDANSSAYKICMNRHDGGINMTFLDSSVRKAGLKELWTLKWHRRYDTANCWTKAGGVQPENWPEWMRKFKDY